MKEFTIDSMEKETAKIFFVDDHEVVLHGLMMSLMKYLGRSPEKNFTAEFVGTARTGGEALERIPESGANVAFVDIMLPDISGLTVIRRLRERGLDKERLRIIVVTELIEPNVREIFASGASAYITKQEDGSTLAEALSALLVEPLKTWVQPDVAQRLLKVEYTLKKYGFTPAEIEILQLLHLRTAEIAERLGVSIATIRMHLTNIYAKLRVAGRKEALEFARFLGILSVSY